MKITLREIKRAEACEEAVESFRARFGESATEAEAFAWLKEHPDWLAWAMGRYVRWCKLLIAHGADANAEDSDGWTPMHYAAYCGHAEVVRLLLANGADANTQDRYGWTPLHHAARNGHGEIVKLLLAHGANVNAKDNYGWTPLHYAACRGHAEAVKILEAAIAKTKGA